MLPTVRMHDLYGASQANEETPASGEYLKPRHWRGIFALGAGTYLLPAPKAGQVIIVRATGSVTLTYNGFTRASLSSGQIIELKAASDSDWTAVGVEASAPMAKYATSSTATNVTPAAADFAGANNVFWENTADGALALTTPTATQILAAFNSLLVPRTYLLTIVNRGDNTITITGGTGVTVSGGNTIATLVTRTYVVNISAVGTVTMTCVSKGTIET